MPRRHAHPTGSTRPATSYTGDVRALDSRERLTVLTPAVSVATIAAGYRPALHTSADPS